MMQFIDTHTHLYSSQFDKDRNQVIEDAIELGIHQFYLPNIDLDSIYGMEELVKNYPNNCFPMMGLHPCSVNAEVETTLYEIKLQLDSMSVIAVGEIGVDLYWDKSFKDQQIWAFREQIKWAKNRKLPIVIHCREAFDEILEVLDDMNDENLTGIFHCFTGTLAQAQHILSYQNFKLGIGGVVTFKNSGLDQVVSELSLNDLVLETDSPYLAPSPYRGKRNESAYLLNIAEKLADIFDVPVAQIAKQTTINAHQIFNT